MLGTRVRHTIVVEKYRPDLPRVTGLACFQPYGMSLGFGAAPQKLHRGVLCLCLGCIICSSTTFGWIRVRIAVVAKLEVGCERMVSGYAAAWRWWLASSRTNQGASRKKTFATRPDAVKRGFAGVRMAPSVEDDSASLLMGRGGMVVLYDDASLPPHTKANNHTPFAVSRAENQNASPVAIFNP